MAGINVSCELNNRPVSLNGGNFNDLQAALFLAFVIPLTVFTAASNSFVIRAVSKFPPLKNPSNLLILSLAATDLLSAVLAMPVACYYNIAGVWKFGKGGCQVWLFLTIFLCASSMLHLCAIAIDRYKAISMPITYGVNRSNRKALGILCIVWSCSFLFASIPFPFPWGMAWPETFQQNTPCAVPMDQPYHIWIFSVTYVIPLVILMVTYAKFYHLNQTRHRQKIRQAAKLMGVKEQAGKSEEGDIQILKTASERLSVSGSTASPHLNSLSKQVNTPQTETTSAGQQKQVGPADDATIGLDDIAVVAEEGEGNTVGDEFKEFRNDGSDAEETFCAVESEVHDKDLIDVDLVSNDRLCGKDDAASANRVPNVCCKLPVKFMVKGSKRRQMTTDLNVLSISLPASRCQQCRATLPKDIEGIICQICSAPNDLILAAKKSRLDILVLKERRSMFIMSIIVCAFFVCWTPSFVLLMLAVAFPSVYVPPWLHFVAWWLFYSNSACNPVIYTIFNGDFRKAFTKMFR